MKSNQSRTSPKGVTRIFLALRSTLTAFCILAFSSCTPEVANIESAPSDTEIARVETPNGTYSLEVVYPDNIAVGELVTLKDSKGYTSNLRSVANQFHEIRAEEPLVKGDLCKIVYYFKGWNNGKNRTCERITAAKIKPEIEKNFGDTPAQTPEPSRTLLLMVGITSVTLRRRRKQTGS